MTIKILSTIGSVGTIGFGVWHFFVPKAYDWYDYMAPEANELVAAVRAINVFFSLSLVLVGLLCLVFVFAPQSNAFAAQVILVVCCVLWLTRVVMQMVFPQGSISPALQYGMLAAFIIIWMLYSVSLFLSLKNGLQ